MPSSLKKAMLLTNLKKPSLDYQEFVNFRPISNLKMVSKVIEKVVASRLTRYLDENNLRESSNLHIGDTKVVKQL